MPTPSEIDAARASARAEAIAELRRAMSIPNAAARAAHIASAFGSGEEVDALIAVTCGRQHARRDRPVPSTSIDMRAAMHRTIQKTPEECAALGRATRVDVTAQRTQG